SYGAMTTGRVRGGFNQYGFTVGILMLDTRFPRIPGDMGNAQTFPFPVRYQRVTGADPDLVVRRGAEGLLPAFVEGAQALEREGVGAITTNCGFLIKYQAPLARSVRVPVFTSSLLLVPLVHRMLAPGGGVGIVTVNAGSLTPEHLTGAGIGSEVPLAVVGMETEKEFTRALLDNELELDVDLAREEHVRVARRLVADHPDVGAIVLECTNMPPYTADIQRETGRPVFDIVSLVTRVHDALVAGRPPGRAGRRRVAPLVAGVDGCRAGWVVVLSEGARSEVTVARDFAGVLGLTRGACVVGVDMPIGLLDAAAPGGRECDRHARRLLGRGRACSVFSPPARR